VGNLLFITSHPQRQSLNPDFATLARAHAPESSPIQRLAGDLDLEDMDEAIEVCRFQRK
jgi:NAD(P)H-dependent FMN reductase